MRRVFSVSVLCLSSLLGAAGCGPNNPAQGTDNHVDAGTVLPAPDMAQAAPHYDYSVTLKSFDLQPGDEQILCQYVPADGTERFVERFVAEMSPGSHHLVVFRVDETRGQPSSFDLTPCTQLEIPPGFDGMLPGSQQQHSDFSLPEGVAFKIGATHGLMFQMHYINATAKTITAKVSWSLGTVPKARVQQEAGMLFYSNYGLMIPPGKSSAEKTCKAPADMFLVTATGHMHKHGLTFDAAVQGNAIYHNDTWDEPAGLLFPAPGRQVKLGDPISWSCSYNNDTGATLKFGNSAATDEMCIFASLYYPATPAGTEFFCNH